MYRFNSVALAALMGVVWMLWGTSAEGALIRLSLVIDEPAGTYEIFAEDITPGPADNAGIARFGVELFNASTRENLAPFGTTTGGDPIGLYDFRLPTAGSPNIIGASQDTFGLGGIVVYGLAQAGGVLPDIDLAEPRAQVSYGVPLLLGQGTFAGPALPAIGTATVDVFESDAGISVAAAQIDIDVIVIPEPAAAALCAAGVGLMVFRRRGR